ncbi:cysteine/glutathione ABC transporter ATP-binding protein/permease CydC [Enterobacteriaceae bacterium LUAb1]
MRTLFAFLPLWRRHSGRLFLGILLAMLTLLASIGLLTLSGWFLAGASLAGVAGLYSFNYMLPAAGVRGAAMIRTAARYFERLVSHDGTFRVLLHLRVDTFSRLIPLYPGAFRHFRQGDLLNRLVTDVDTLDHFYLRLISPLLSAFIVIITVTLGLNFLDPLLAAILGGVLFLTLLILPPLFWQLGRPAGEMITQQRARYRLELTRFLQGQSELTIYNALSVFRQQLDNTEASWQQAQRTQAVLSGLSQAILMIMMGAAVTLLLWISAGGIAHLAPPGAGIALIVFCAMASFEALNPVAGAFLHLGQICASAERLNAILTTKAAVVFPASHKHYQAGDIEFSQVQFGYPEQPDSVLHNINLHIPHGSHVAFIGRTGCGKSTLLQLLTRAWDPVSGHITFGDCALTSWDEASLRRVTSVVSQRDIVLSATLRDNLLLAAPQASDDQLVSILYNVGLHKLLNNTAGLNAWIGDGGRLLSGGELRRLSIARALLHNGELLLLDEPTEGLDRETERQILDLLTRVTVGKTVIMVTHRLPYLEHLDHIYVIDEGRIIEDGDHADLLSRRGRYWTFYQQITV